MKRTKSMQLKEGDTRPLQRPTFRFLLFLSFVIVMMHDSIKYLLDLACECQYRGGYTLAEAVTLNSIRQRLLQNDTDNDDDKAATTTAADREKNANDEAVVQRLVLQAQANGKLSLEEAWTAYNAIKMLAAARAPAPPVED